MAELIESARLIDLILVMVVIEAVALVLLHRQTGQGIAPRALIGFMLAGGFLLLAIRAALTDAGWIWIGLWLTLALIAHLADLALRWQTTPNHPSSAKPAQTDHGDPADTSRRGL